MKIGGWEVKVAVDAMPQKCATAFSEITYKLVGASYVPLAYLGSQLVNGTNHAILAEQTILTGTDHKNIVLMTINEKPEGCTLAGIEPILESGGECGGYDIDAKIKDNIPKEALDAFNAVMADFVGSNVKPFAYLGSQVVNGVNYAFAAEVAPVVENPKTAVKLVVANAVSKTVTFENILG